MPERPIVSVGVVVFRNDSALLIRRGKPPFLGQWSIPGGKVEYGESLHEAARREVFEETAVRVEIDGLIDVFEALPSGAGEKHFVMADFYGRWLSGEPIAGDDAADAAFVPIREAITRVSWDETRRAVASAAQLAGLTAGE